MTTSAPLPGAVQHLVEQIYDVAVHDVARFLITDRRTADRLGEQEDDDGISEKLLVAERDGCLDLALFLDESVLERLRSADPLEDLHDQNLADFWLVVEGISHFVYLAWNASHDRPVRLLELELQAEIDKFVIALYLLRRQGRRGLSRELHSSLFDSAGYHAGLDAQTLTRYRHANRYAGKYCRSLHRRFLRRARRPGLISELRRFYRLRQPQKLRHIEAVFCCPG